jgi:cellobiose phosphorylase
VEIALNEHAADRAHPAFSKLFIQTESLAERGALFANRRPRDEDDPQLWAMHMVAGSEAVESWGGENGDLTISPPHHPTTFFETDRARFIGRNRSVADPIALRQPLSGTVGAVLDPIFSLRRRVTIAPNQRVYLSFLTGAGDSREAMLHLVEKYSDAGAIERAMELAWVHAQLEMHHLRVRPDETQLFQQLAAGVLYPHLAFRAPAARLRENTRGQSGLWSYGISGDLPIISVVVDHERDLPAVRQALIAHSFWRLHGLKADLVILNQQAGGYHQELTDKLESVARPFEQYVGLNTNGGIFIRARETMPEEDLTLILAASHIVMIASRGRLAQQLSNLPGAPAHAPRLVIAQRPAEEPSAQLPFLELPYFNGLGGFTTDGGREYCVYLGPNNHTPAPWINVMANPAFGQMVSEAGNGFAWWGNSQANRLTDWSNDPVADPINDAIYIRDDDTGAFWTPTAGPIRERDAYRARHGQGYTVYEHNSHAIEQEVVTFVPLSSGREAGPESAGETEPPLFPSAPPPRFSFSPPLRLQRLRLRNASSRRRRLTLTGYHEWVLGTDREQTQLHVITSWDTQSQTLLAHNCYHPDYSTRVAFSTSSPAPENFTTDRTAFLGRNGRLSNPAVLRREHLTDRTGAGLDPCAATQLRVELAPGETTEITFLMGQCESIEDVRELVEKFREPAQVENALQETKRAWDEILGALEVSTPIDSINFLLNRWLLYQNLSCRVWGRSAFYQSGGAWGFRDQLQDVMALVYTMPEIVRAQILRAAAHQFEEGDVQHWWHEPSGAGVRTRITDDLLFLPYVTSHYIRVTGDVGVLDEEVHFLSAPPLEEGEDEKYFAPDVTDYKATIYEHCLRAIERGSTQGAHNLPLIGTGDWNDGLNRVGEHGKGESVWLAWFLIDVLRGFADIIAVRDKALAKKLRARATRYAKAVEENAWDGAWYRRAYYDDGTPLGSKESDEAKIDVLPQAWAAISGAGDEERTTQALASADEILVKPEDKMILLFTPPFDKTPKNPGYIKGYLPGVRENGGQYTHGALWLTLAHAQRGDGDKAVELLQLLNPVEHARNEAQASLYKTEPYVVAADVYSLKGQVGRGGWTWYTGSAGWMYRVWIEAVLGFQPRADKLFIRPAIPKDWKEYSLRYRHQTSTYEIKIENPDGKNGGVAEIKMDGKPLSKKENGERFIPLKDDGKTHHITVRLGEAGSTPASLPESKAIVKMPQKEDENGAASPQQS